MARKMIRLGGISLLVAFVLTGCYYDNEEYYYASSVVTCDTSAVSYSADIEPAINRGCYGCHGNASAQTVGAGINLEGHTNIAAYMATSENRFVGAIKQGAGYSPMPKGGGKLSDCDISKIELWLNASYPNN